jgi:alpha-beta hydrolase superfamily lysophospholipase
MEEGGGISRRSVIVGGGMGLGIGWLAQGGAREAPAQPRSASTGEIWSGEYWAKKGAVSLSMYRKRLGQPKAGAPALPVLVLVHGSSISSRPSFDLTVPGRGEYSLMNVFASYGYDVWTLDHEGYGRSTRTESNSDIASGVEDLKVATEVIARETGQPRFHFYGGSSGWRLRRGATRAGGPSHPRSVHVDGQGLAHAHQACRALEYFRTHHRRPRGRDMIRSIFTRDKPGTSDPAVAEALADAELQHGDTIPTGTYLDMTANLPVVDPARVKSPVLLVRGEHDGIATEEDLLEFYRRLPNQDRQFIILAGASHAVALGLTRRQLWHVMRAFLSMPSRAES